MMKYVAGFSAKLKAAWRASYAALPLIAAAMLPALGSNKFALGTAQWTGTSRTPHQRTPLSS